MSKELKDPCVEMARVIGKDLTDSEASCLFSTFASQANLIAQGVANDRDVSSLYMQIQIMVKTATKNKLVSSYTFDGLVPMSFGQRSTVLQYVLKGSDLNCAKIGDPVTIGKELRIARLIHEDQVCPTVMPVLDFVNISETRLAMIAPFYPLPLSHVDVQARTVVNAAICGLATIKAFFNKNLCHGDIKPSNMMLQSSSRTIVTIDYGSTVQYGDTILATSPLFGLDCPTEGSLQYDLTCLATSILFLMGINLNEFTSRAQVREWLKFQTGTPYSLASICLDPGHESVETIWQRCTQVVKDVHPDADWIVNCDSVWPLFPCNAKNLPRVPQKQ